MVQGIDLDHVQLTPQLVAAVPASIAHEFLALPIEIRGDTLVLAVPDPNDIELFWKLLFHLNREVELVGAPVSQLKLAVWQHY